MVVALALGVLSACDSLLEVELPSQLTDDALENPKSAQTLVNSVIASFECAYSSLAYEAMGHEDVWERVSGNSAPAQYATSPAVGVCDLNRYAGNWYSNIQTSRALAEKTYARLAGEWTAAQVPNRERLQAILALYTAANMSVLGEFFCEVAVDAGPLMAPEAALARGEEWIEKALGHLRTTGDFALPHEISSSAQTTAYALRARLRWARGDHAGALADARRIPKNFTALVTRDAAPTRRNKIATAGFLLPYAVMLDVNDWWRQSAPNPVTGRPWPSPIPFTGYLNLGILPDGRAVTDAGLPIRTTVNAQAVRDRRVMHVVKAGAAGTSGPAPMKFTTDDDDIPLISWREIWLIRAEIEGGQTAIDLVNDLRVHHGLPRVSYVSAASREQVRYMVLEEKRRELWAEGGRWWSTKIKNPDVLWFPRDLGNFPGPGNFSLLGGVRMIMPITEYDNNPNTSRADRATLCRPAERPVGFI